MGELVGPRWEIESRLRLFRCPGCRGPLELNTGLACRACKVGYYDERYGIVDLTPARLSGTKQKISTFWGDTYQQWYEPDDSVRTADALKRELALLEDLLRQRHHLAVEEINLNALSGREMLEVGCGAGGHSALFLQYGARVTAMDITPERARSTNHKFSLMRNGTFAGGLAIRADAEALPFADNAFDLVYSNGVLHHTEDTAACVRECFRVLKPGGEASIMLYAKHSAYYWCRLVPKGVLTGLLFRLPEARWLGRITEGRPQYRQEENPITRVFSKRQLMAMFGQFDLVSLRRNSFSISHLPIPGVAQWRESLLRALDYKMHEGGRLVYGQPIIPETKLEVWLGGVMGWGWNIRARKPQPSGNWADLQSPE